MLETIEDTSQLNRSPTLSCISVGSNETDPIFTAMKEAGMKEDVFNSFFNPPHEDAANHTIPHSSADNRRCQPNEVKYIYMGFKKSIKLYEKNYIISILHLGNYREWKHFSVRPDYCQSVNFRSIQKKKATVWI